MNALKVAPYIVAASVGFEYGGELPALAEVLVQEKSAGNVFARVASWYDRADVPSPATVTARMAFMSRGTEGTVAYYTLVMRRGAVLMVLVEVEVPPLQRGPVGEPVRALRTACSLESPTSAPL